MPSSTSSLRDKSVKTHTLPVSVGAAAIYEYREGLIDLCHRVDEMDKDVSYSLCRVVGEPPNLKLWLPRNMAPQVTSDLRADGLDIALKSSFKPRNSEQERCIKEIVALLKKGENFVFEAPTGFGKTWCAADIISKVGKKTLVVVTKMDIVDQWVEALEKLLGLQPGKDIGVMSGDKAETLDRKVVVALVQSIAKEGRYASYHFKDFGLAIFDEVHRVGADFFSQACFRVPAKLRLGISATPSRKDGRDEVIHAHIGPVRVRTEALPMTPRVIVQESPWHIPMRRKLDREGRLVMKDGSPVMVPIEHSALKSGHVIRMLSNHHGRNAMIAHFVHQAYTKGRKVLIQSDRLDHLDTLKSLIGTKGVPLGDMAHYVGGLTKGQRDAAKKASVIFATYSMTAEATDIPTLDTLVMATPKSDVRQIVGRILRFVEGKKEPLIFDIRDSSSPLFSGYAGKRDLLYRQMKASTTTYP